MKVVVIGCGHVGLVTAATLGKLGHDVVGVDNDPDRVALLQSGRAPFYEPGLGELVGLACYTEDAAEALDGADAAFICVNTPPAGEGKLNLVYVERAARTIAEHARGPLVVVEKSTVPVHTARRIMDVVRGTQIEVVCNPEFLREGMAVHDSFHPDRIVVGLAGPGRAEAVMRELYAGLDTEWVVTDLETAEMIKHASNSFLATKVSFINAVAALCEKAGADVDVVARGMGLDPRIGPDFLRAGIGYGGSCFPKDVSAFIAYARDLHVHLGLLDEVRTINALQIDRLLEKIRRAVWNLDGKTIAVWGLSFKPGTDDLREAPSLAIIPALVKEGARVRAYDPAVKAFPDVDIAPNAMKAVEGADALVVLTEWPEFIEANLNEVHAALAQPVIVDGRNVWSVTQMQDLGFTYVSFGRPEVS